MNQPFRQLQDIIAPAVMALGFELVGCEFHQQYGRSLLRIYVDGPQGIGLEDCAKVSRQIAAVLDVEDPIRGRYTLEVSSPGLDRPLFTIDHFRRFIGRQVNVLLRQPKAGRRRYRGVILTIEDDQITLKVDESMVKFAFNDINKANLIGE